MKITQTNAFGPDDPIPPPAPDRKVFYRTKRMRVKTLMALLRNVDGDKEIILSSVLEDEFRDCSVECISEEKDRVRLCNWEASDWLDAKNRS